MLVGVSNNSLCVMLCNHVWQNVVGTKCFIAQGQQNGMLPLEVTILLLL